MLTVLCLNRKSVWARLSVFSVYSDQYELKLLCYDHTDNMTSGSNIFNAFLSNLSLSSFWFYENYHLRVCENKGHQQYFLSLVANPVTIKLASRSGTNELAHIILL